VVEVVRVGSGGVCDRNLYVIEATSSDDVPAVLALPCPYFACLLAWDATAVADAEVIALARRLLQAGYVYVCCWGPGCSRVHDLFDLAGLDIRPDDLIMSTWHDDETLSEALWFFLFCAFPDEAYVEQCRAGVGVVIGSREWADEVRAALTSPDAFSSELLGSDGGSA
jgi:hypothetical protein